MLNAFTLFSKPVTSRHRLLSLGLMAAVWFALPHPLMAIELDAMEKRAVKIRAAMRSKLIQLETGEEKPKAVEAYCTAWQPDELYRRFPLLKAQLRICAGRAAMKMDQLTLAKKRFQEAQYIAKSAHPDLFESRAVQMESAYRQAEVTQKKLLSQTSCIGTLGLTKLRRFQSERLLRQQKESEMQFIQVVKAKIEPWSALAAIRIASLHQTFLSQFFLSPQGSFRGVDLPEPFEILTAARFRLGEELYPQYPLILGEVDRLISELESRSELQEHRDAVRNLKARQQELKAGMHKVVTKVKNPYYKDEELREGTISWHKGRMVRKTLTGSWRPMEPKEQQQFMKAIFAKGPLPTTEFLLAWSASVASGSKFVNEAWLDWALGHEDPFTVFTGLYVLQMRPNARYLPQLLRVWKTVNPSGDPGFNDVFRTMSGALFGLPERTLLALRALVKYQRQTAITLFYNNKDLPPAERAWVLGDLGDPNLIYRYHEMAAHAQKEVAAIGLYASYFTSGGKATWLLTTQSRNKEPLVRCMAKALLAFDEEKNTAGQKKD